MTTNTMTAHPTESQHLPESAEQRRPRDATPIVVARYALMVLAAPLLVRYGPGPESVQVVAPAMATAAAASPCAQAADSLPRCPPAQDDLD